MSEITENTPVLFLDIDGVLHPSGIATQQPDGNVSGERLFRWLPKFLEALSQFPTVKVVLHSTWRYCFQNEAHLRNNLPKELSDIILETTDVTVMSRYASIEAYIKTKNLCKYLILDDEANAFPYKLKELVICRANQGLSRQSTYNRLIEELKRISS